MTDPTPATPDEAVVALAEAMPCDDEDCDGTPHQVVAGSILADLAIVGWTLSRQQGDAVAARVDEAMVERVARALWEETDPLMPDATDIVPWPDVTEYSKKQWRDRARAILGIVADGAGDGR